MKTLINYCRLPHKLYHYKVKNVPLSKINDRITPFLINKYISIYKSNYKNNISNFCSKYAYSLEHISSIYTHNLITLGYRKFYSTLKDIYYWEKHSNYS